MELHITKVPFQVADVGNSKWKRKNLIIIALQQCKIAQFFLCGEINANTEVNQETPVSIAFPNFCNY